MLVPFYIAILIVLYCFMTQLQGICMTYGYAEYVKILNLLDKFNIALNNKEFEKFKRELVDILKL